MYRIAFVCLGNICRSPMADVVLTARVEEAGLADRVTVASSGTGDWHVGHPMDHRAAATLAAAGYDPTRHRAQQFAASWLDEFDLVLAMDKIGRIINGQKGKVVIEGHTDARPFKSANYDNWRLSTARAQSAYYMLVRGGVEERRIVEVSGFADRRPKDPADPLSAVNRRIEIRLETGG